MSGIRFVVCVLAGCASVACRSPGDDRPADLKYETIRPELRGTDTTVSRQSLRFWVGFQDRTAPSGDPVDEGVAIGVDGVFDLSRTVLTPSIEIGIGYTSAHVSMPDTSSLDMWRATLGFRGTWYTSGWRPYARAGGYLRWSTDDVDEPLDPYATGLYLGIGADWPFLSGMWLGPNITYYHALDEESDFGDSEELLIAVSATFRL